MSKFKYPNGRLFRAMEKIGGFSVCVFLLGLILLYPAYLIDTRIISCIVIFLLLFIIPALVAGVYIVLRFMLAAFFHEALGGFFED